MTGTHPAPPLPPPQQPAEAARQLAAAAHATATAWTQPQEPSGRRRAISQLRSALRDIGIATRSLARDNPGTATPRSRMTCPGYAATAAMWLLTACDSLHGTADADPSQLPDLDDPGTALCLAARAAIRAWRAPSGTHAADYDATVRQVIVATGWLTTATLGLTAYGPLSHASSLQAAGASIGRATYCLTAILHPLPDSPHRPHSPEATSSQPWHADGR